MRNNKNLKKFSIFSNATLLELRDKIKLVLKTIKTLKTNVIGVFKALLVKVGIWNKYTEPFFIKAGTAYKYLIRVWLVINFSLRA